LKWSDIVNLFGYKGYLLLFELIDFIELLTFRDIVGYLNGFIPFD
jgi:hypothetical protein